MLLAWVAKSTLWYINDFYKMQNLENKGVVFKFPQIFVKISLNLQKNYGKIW